MLKAHAQTGLVFFPAYDWAISPTHPEREERLLYTQDQFLEEGILDIEGIVELRPQIAQIEDIQRVHFCLPDVQAVTAPSHLIAAGAAITMADAIQQGRVERGFALVRPPGHHAMRVAWGGRGFCNINNEAIMVEYLRQHYGLRRIAIVDTDCHHGDGTQDIFWHDPDTLFISIHQDGRTLYPGTGFPNDMGGPNAFGSTINIPLPPRTSDEGYLKVMTEVVMPILQDFGPEIVINSAGQDNHFKDPLTNENITARGYGDLTRILNPDIIVLEGGYSLENALPYLNTAIILAMARLDYDHVIEPQFDTSVLRQSPDITSYIDKLCTTILRNWENRHELRQLRFANSRDYHLTQRDIYYDTDEFSEHQDERIRLCNQCGGTLEIRSRRAGIKPVLLVHIPHHACSACIACGHRWLTEAERSAEYSQVILQDRTEDSYNIA